MVSVWPSEQNSIEVVLVAFHCECSRPLHAPRQRHVPFTQSWHVVSMSILLPAIAAPCWPSAPLNVSRSDLNRVASDRSTAFLHTVKRHILDALEALVPALAGVREPGSFWSNGSSALDVGAGSGEIPLYLQRKYNLLCRGVDVVKPANNRFFATVKSNGRGREYLPIELFDGRSLPFANASFDMVMFVSVLHHAANSTVDLVREAARVARRYIIVLEDLHLPASHALHHAIEQRNHDHEPHGIFRTLEEWISLFRATPAVRDVRHDMLCPFVIDRSSNPCGSHERGVPKRESYVLFLVEVQS